MRMREEKSGIATLSTPHRQGGNPAHMKRDKTTASVAKKVGAVNA